MLDKVLYMVYNNGENKERRILKMRRLKVEKNEIVRNGEYVVATCGNPNHNDKNGSMVGSKKNTWKGDNK